MANRLGMIKSQEKQKEQGKRLALTNTATRFYQ